MQPNRVGNVLFEEWNTAAVRHHCLLVISVGIPGYRVSASYACIGCLAIQNELLLSYRTSTFVFGGVFGREALCLLRSYAGWPTVIREYQSSQSDHHRKGLKL